MVAAYLRGNSAPRYMRRIRELDGEYARQREALADAYRRLAEACGHDGERFAAEWRAIARGWSFEDLNQLVREHNAWYPLEVDLPMDPRTRDFVTIRGATYRRLELEPRWVLAHFPPEPDAEAPKPPARAPREPH